MRRAFLADSSGTIPSVANLIDHGCFYGKVGIPADYHLDRLVPSPANQTALDLKQSDAPVAVPRHDRNGSISAGQEIKKLPLSEISWPMSGDQPSNETARAVVGALI